MKTLLLAVLLTLSSFAWGDACETPVLTSLLPSASPNPPQSFVLQAIGYGFVGNNSSYPGWYMTLTFNGVERPAKVKDWEHLTAVIDVSELQQTGDVQVWVTKYAPSCDTTVQVARLGNLPKRKRQKP